jgi:hypothetical protein
MKQLKLGRRNPKWGVHHMRASFRASAVFDALNDPPPASADFISAVSAIIGTDWGMLLNDQLGDCTSADCGHALMLRTANTGTWVQPKDSDILAVYEATGQYNPADPSTDQGAEESVVCDYMEKVGLLGHKSVGTAAVATGTIDSNALDRIRWSVQMFGACRLGVNLPNDAEDQFSANTPWALTPGQTAVGGHDIPVVGYTPEHLTVVTWGRLQLVNWDWLKTWGEEAHVELFPDFLMSTGLTPSGFSLDQLVADLKTLMVPSF